ncbi:MAG: DUF2959 family protein [Desulfuromonadaceae bacterium]|nr:DUF2959 family protein [Desulfuromonadaceae bacterium]
MKIRSQSVAFLAMLLLGTAALLGGCATTGMDRSVKASNSIRDVDDEIRKMKVQIDITASSLESLVAVGQPDLKKSFDTYSKDLKNLESEGKRVIKRSEEMKAHSKEYFAEWEKQGEAFTNPEIRELSAERRERLAEIYARVPAAAVGINRTYQAYLTDLKEIQKYLSTDLTRNGVDAIAPIAQKSVRHLDELKLSLNPVIIALDEIKSELYIKKK